MDKYEKVIGLKTIWLTLIRRWKMIFLIFIPIALASFIVTRFVLVKTYTSSVTLNRMATISAAQYSVMKSFVEDTSDNEEKPGAVFTTAKNLKENKIFHSNGNEITVSEIKSGLSFTALASNSTTMTFSFQSTDSAITKPVLDELAAVSIEYLQSESRITSYKDYVNLKATEATNASKNSKENTYLLVGIAGGAVLALGMAFIDEIMSDEVYDAKDIRDFGVESFDLKTKREDKE